MKQITGAGSRDELAGCSREQRVKNLDALIQTGSFLVSVCPCRTGGSRVFRGLARFARV